MRWFELSPRRRVTIAILVLFCLWFVARVGFHNGSSTPTAAFDETELAAGTAMDRGDYAAAARLIQPWAVKGNPKAQLDLGMAYLMGNGVDHEPKEAMTWFRRAAEQGDIVAQSMIGTLYRDGDGVPKDPVRAWLWFDFAAKNDANQKDEPFAGLRDAVARYSMSPAQLAEAQHLSAENWRPEPLNIDRNGAEQGWIGATVQSVTPDIGEALNIDPPRGALIAEVDEHGPSKAAGLMPGDVIIKIDGQDVKDLADLHRVVGAIPGKENIEIVVIRGGKEEMHRLSVAQRKPESSAAPLAQTGASETAKPDSSNSSGQSNEAAARTFIADLTEWETLLERATYTELSPCRTMVIPDDFDACAKAYAQARQRVQSAQQAMATFDMPKCLEGFIKYSFNGGLKTLIFAYSQGQALASAHNPQTLEAASELESDGYSSMKSGISFAKTLLLNGKCS